MLLGGTNTQLINNKLLAYKKKSFLRSTSSYHHYPKTLDYYATINEVHIKDDVIFLDFYL